MPSTQPAKRRSNTLTVVLVAALAALGFEQFWQRFNSHRAPDPATDSGGCLFEARSAANYYGTNVRPFYNPPSDPAKWVAFRTELEKRISSAELKCSSCFEGPCNRARTAMSELRSVVSELDSAGRSGTLPPTPGGISVRLQRMNDALR